MAKATGGERTALFLRGLPQDLVREAKAAAALRGMTLAALVREALAQNLGGRRSSRVLPRELARAMAWYERHREEMMRRHRGEYLAIGEHGVIDHDREFEPLARRVFGRVGVRPVFMPKVESEDRVVDIPTPHIDRSS